MKEILTDKNHPLVQEMDKMKDEILYELFKESLLEPGTGNNAFDGMVKSYGINPMTAYKHIHTPYGIIVIKNSPMFREFKLSDRPRFIIKNDGDNGSTEADEGDLASTESEVEIETPEESEPTNGGTKTEDSNYEECFMCVSKVPFIDIEKEIEYQNNLIDLIISEVLSADLPNFGGAKLNTIVKMKNAILDCWDWLEPKPRTESIWLSTRLKNEELLENQEELINSLRNIIEPIKDEILNLGD